MSLSLSPSFINPPLLFSRSSNSSQRHHHHQFHHNFRPRPHSRHVSSQRAIIHCSQSDLNAKTDQYFASCLRGLGHILALELQSPLINATVHTIASSGVTFHCDRATAYAACLWLRTATRVLSHISTVSSTSVYDAVYSCDWPLMLNRGRLSFSVQVRGDHIATMNVGVRAKDAICDKLRDCQCPKPDRPDNHASADVPIFIAVHREHIVIYRDMAGASLHKRGYRSDGVLHKSSLNESVAAAMLYMSGFSPLGTFNNNKNKNNSNDSQNQISTANPDNNDVQIIDPMCGSATLGIEAALLRLRVAVGLYRRMPFPFEKWHDFDAVSYACVRNNAIDTQLPDSAVTTNTRIEIADINPSAVSLARRDLARTRLQHLIHLKQADALEWTLSNTKQSSTIVVSNPPWGRRLSNEQDAWHTMGSFLRRNAPGGTAALLSGDPSLTRGVRMKARTKHPVRIGNIDTRVLVYDILPSKQNDPDSGDDTNEKNTETPLIVL